MRTTSSKLVVGNLGQSVTEIGQKANQKSKSELEPIHTYNLTTGVDNPDPDEKEKQGSDQFQFISYSLICSMMFANCFNFHLDRSQSIHHCFN